MGNLLSVLKALEYLGEDAEVVAQPDKLADASRIILPGVGAFPDAMASLAEKGWIAALEREVLGSKKPFLGICLGMQLLAETGEENGRCQGLGWIKGEVKRFAFADHTLKVPHVGWNEVAFTGNSPLSSGVGSGATFYFVHSYHLVCREHDDVAAWCDYGGPFVAAVRKGNIAATQFHPEKSQDNGLRVLENFVSWQC